MIYTKVHDRLLRPLLAANSPPAPRELRQALATIDRHVHNYVTRSRMGNAARKSKINVRSWNAEEH